MIQLIIEVAGFLLLPVGIFLNQMSGGKLASNLGHTNSKGVNLGFGLTLLAINVISLWATVELAQRFLGQSGVSEKAIQSSPSDNQVTNVPLREGAIEQDTPNLQPDVSDRNSLELGSNGTAVATWENYGSVDSEKPYTHYISRNISRLNIRNGPGTEYRVVGTRRGGLCIRVIDVRGSWSKVVVPTASGPWAYYASNRYLTPIRPSQSCN